MTLCLRLSKRRTLCLPCRQRGKRPASTPDLAIVLLDLEQVVAEKVGRRLEALNGRVEEVIRRAVDRELDRLIGAELELRIGVDDDGVRDHERGDREHGDRARDDAGRSGSVVSPGRLQRVSRRR